MSVQHIIISSLIAFAILVCVLSSVGVFVMRGAYDKLHYLAPPTQLGMAGVGLAIFLERGWSPESFKAGLALAVLALSGPVLTHGIARAILSRSSRLESESSR